MIIPNLYLSDRKLILVYNLNNLGVILKMFDLHNNLS